MRALFWKLLSLCLFGLCFYGAGAFTAWQPHPVEWPMGVRGAAVSLTLGAWVWDSLKNA